MTILYHSGKKGILAGSRYRGSIRGELSILLGGPVGFAYGYLPERWKLGENIYELSIPDEELVIVAINDNNIPRQNYHGYNWDDMCKIIPAREAKQFEGEITFLESSIYFKDN